MPEYTKLQHTIQVQATKLKLIHTTYNTDITYNITYTRTMTTVQPQPRPQHTMTTVQLQHTMITIQLQHAS